MANMLHGGRNLATTKAEYPVSVITKMAVAKVLLAAATAAIATALVISVGVGVCNISIFNL